MKKSLLLFAFCIFVRVAFSQCYTVSQITYAPDSFNVGTAFAYAHDDLFSDTIPLPFPFCFYGASYSKIVFGENGVVSFNASDRNNYCVWPIGSPIPTTGFIYKNVIFFPYQDLLSNSNPRFYTNTYGVSPNRRFVISIYRCPMYGDTTKHFTGETILYETTNVIEIQIQRKDLVAGWNGGNGIEGIHNSTGTMAETVPGRNYPVQWTAYNDAWRFTPSCNVCSGLGIATTTENNPLEIFPNPASNEIHVKFLNPNSEKFSIELEDVDGRIIYQDEFSSETERILKPNASAGIYFVRIINENGETLETKKLAIE
jgi:hypothetical protein